jgi:hypothetical protein
LKQYKIKPIKAKYQSKLELLARFGQCIANVKSKQAQVSYIADKKLKLNALQTIIE